MVDRLRLTEIPTDKRYLLIVTARGSWVTGGTDSYMGHMYHAAEAAGLVPVLVKLHHRSESFSRTTTHLPAPYTNMTIPHIREWLKKGHDVVICNVDSRNNSLTRDRLFSSLLKQFSTCHLAVHCPAHVKDFTIKRKISMDHMAGMVICVGHGVRRIVGENGVFLPHPYAPLGEPEIRKEKVAICPSLVMECKHIDIVMSANKLLPSALHIPLIGRVDRLYVHRKLRFQHLDYERFLPKTHKGHKGFWSGTKRCQKFKLCVNLTTVRGDGGRTEYCTLEAWDAGCVPVVHREWVSGVEDKVMVPYNGYNEGVANCYAVSTAHELADLVRDVSDRMILEETDLERQLIENGHKELARHTPEVVGQQLKNILDNPARKD